ncbi:MAG TPA: MCP four helix bundle domain-containing protein, partial [Burkholderiaceae bacterium]
MNTKNLSIGKRLTLQSAALLALLLIVGLLGVRALSGADAGLRSVYEDNTVPLVHLGETLGAAFQARSLVVSGMGAESSEASEQYYKDLKPTQAQVAKLLEQYQASVGTDTKDLAAAKDTAGAWLEFAALNEKVVETAKSGDFEAASQLMRGDAAKKFEAVRSAIQAQMKSQREQARESFESTSATHGRARFLTWTVLLVGLLGAGAMSWLTLVSIREPLLFSVRVAERVAEGDLTQTIRSDRKDELGQLLAALGAMQARLHALVGGVRYSADSISTASAEIAAGTQDLSQRTEETASSLQSTASSMSEFNNTITQSSESARQAKQLAVSAADVAQRGG